MDRALLGRLFPQARVEPRPAEHHLREEAALAKKIEAASARHDSKEMSRLLLQLLLSRLVLALEADPPGGRRHLADVQAKIDKYQRSFCFLYNAEVDRVSLVLRLLQGADIILAGNVLELSHEYYQAHRGQFLKADCVILASKFLTACLMAQMRQRVDYAGLFRTCLAKRGEWLACAEDDREEAAVVQVTVYLLLRSAEQEPRSRARTQKLQQAQQLLLRHGQSPHIPPQALKVFHEKVESCIREDE